MNLNQEPLKRTFGIRAVMSVTTDQRRMNSDGAWSTKLVLSHLLGTDPAGYHHLGGDFHEHRLLCVPWLLLQYPELPLAAPLPGGELERWCGEQEAILGDQIDIWSLSASSLLIALCAERPASTEGAKHIGYKFNRASLYGTSNIFLHQVLFYKV